MFRSFITAVVAIGSLLGPQWCCCSVGGSIERLMGCVHAETLARDSAIPGCPFCAASGAPGDSADSAPAEGHSCPCRERKQPSLAGLPGGPSTVDVAAGVPAWQDDGGCTWVVRCAVVGSASPRGLCFERRPALFGRALLRACGVMRC